MDEAAVAAPRGETPIPDARLQALRPFAEAVVGERGVVAPPRWTPSSAPAARARRSSRW
jgi:hypothetical protein